MDNFGAETPADLSKKKAKQKDPNDIKIQIDLLDNELTTTKTPSALNKKGPAVIKKNLSNKRDNEGNSPKETASLYSVVATNGSARHGEKKVMVKDQCTLAVYNEEEKNQEPLKIKTPNKLSYKLV